MDGNRNAQAPYVRPPAPAPRGGHATPPGAPRPRAPLAPRGPVVTPTSTAMDAFRTALAQLNAATPQVDSAAIYAPYRASEQVTGQLGAGYLTAEQNAGAAAQQQYATGRDAAQQHAAQFGISAGAGANPTALTDNGTQALAQQTAAYQAAAPAATAQWQALLERTAGAKVGDAQLAREQGLTTAKQSLATSLPGAIGNEEDRAFQRHTQRFNEHLAESQLTDKQAADLRNYGLDVYKANNTAATATANRNAANKRSANSIAAANYRAELTRRGKDATTKGLKGIAAATKALSGSTSSAGTKKVAKGWDVTVQAVDPYTGDPTGATKVIRLPDKRNVPKGFKFVSAETHYSSVPTSAGSAGMTASQWDVQMRSLLAQNPGRGADVKRFLGPRPKK